MEDKNINATRLYIPILTVVGMLSGLLVIVWFAATKTADIANIIKDQAEMKAQLRDTPTRTEYNDLKTSINTQFGEVKKAIEDLSKEIRSKK